MRPRPTFTPTGYENSPQYIVELDNFREEERAWFEELLANPHVQSVLKIPEDEPIFVLRAKDKFTPRTVRKWIEMIVQDVGNGKPGTLPLALQEKLGKADQDISGMLEW